MMLVNLNKNNKNVNHHGVGRPQYHCDINAADSVLPPSTNYDVMNDKRNRYALDFLFSL